MAKQKDATLSSRGRNTINELSNVLAEASTPMFYGAISFDWKPTRAERRQALLSRMFQAQRQARQALSKARC